MAKHHRDERIASLTQQIEELSALLEGENLGKLLKDIKRQKKKGVPEENLLSEAEHAITLINAHADLAIAKAKLTALQGEGND